MSLVASRFHTWWVSLTACRRSQYNTVCNRTKPVMFHTAIVRRHNNWMRRISDCLLTNASFIHVLVLDLPLTQGGVRGQLAEEELSSIRQLLKATGRVRHLAVTWNVWAYLQRECGALRLESIYLIWDRACNVLEPSLHHLQHPAVLKDLAIYAPCSLPYPDWWRRAQLFLPATTQCVNLAYVTYATDSIPWPGVQDSKLKWAMLVLLGRTEPHEDQAQSIKTIREKYPNFSAVCMQYFRQVLEEWVAKMEGRESLLYHPVDTVMDMYTFTYW
ncbi:hypothetical protein B0H11DRAFT_2400680 [Mycena galericulata]|nr:hypothetical protein B0H11DRAFT_2400680 [Mycena galericulata]